MPIDADTQAALDALTARVATLEAAPKVDTSAFAKQADLEIIADHIAMAPVPPAKPSDADWAQMSGSERDAWNASMRDYQEKYSTFLLSNLTPADIAYLRKTVLQNIQ